MPNRFLQKSQKIRLVAMSLKLLQWMQLWLYWPVRWIQLSFFYLCAGYCYNFIFTTALDATLMLFLSVRWLQLGFSFYQCVGCKFYFIFASALIATFIFFMPSHWIQLWLYFYQCAGCNFDFIFTSALDAGRMHSSLGQPATWLPISSNPFIV